MKIVKRNVILTILIVGIGIIVAILFFQQKEYITIGDLEKLFQKYKISYDVLPVSKEYLINTAKEQTIFLIEDNDVYVYIVDEPYFEQAVLNVSNEMFNDRTVATVNNFIFAYSDKNIERFYGDLYAVIDEIRESRKGRR